MERSPRSLQKRGEDDLPALTSLIDLSQALLEPRAGCFLPDRDRAALMTGGRCGSETAARGLTATVLTLALPRRGPLGGGGNGAS
jgi:hypothetical protein